MGKRAVAVTSPCYSTIPPAPKTCASYNLCQPVRRAHYDLPSLPSCPRAHWLFMSGQQVLQPYGEIAAPGVAHKLTLGSTRCDGARRAVPDHISWVDLLSQKHQALGVGGHSNLKSQCVISSLRASGPTLPSLLPIRYESQTNPNKPGTDNKPGQQTRTTNQNNKPEQTRDTDRPYSAHVILRQPPCQTVMLRESHPPAIVKKKALRRSRLNQLP